MFNKDKHCAGAIAGFVLVIVGAINWGLVGLGNFLGNNLNVVSLLFGSWSWLENAIYVLVGLAGIMLVAGCKCHKCHDGKCDDDTCCGHDHGHDHGGM